MLFVTAFLLTTSLVVAVDFSDFDPQPGLPEEFQPFLEA